jgi:hypothetical protein
MPHPMFLQLFLVGAGALAHRAGSSYAIIARSAPKREGRG